MQNKIIDLAEYKSPKSRVYSGRERGQEVRKAMQLDLIDKDSNTFVTINIPEDTFSINTSFFLGLFGKSVRELGEDGFKQKYRFNANHVILKNIVEGIERAQKEKSVL